MKRLMSIKTFSDSKLKPEEVLVLFSYRGELDRWIGDNNRLINEHVRYENKERKLTVHPITDLWNWMIYEINLGLMGPSMFHSFKEKSKAIQND